jgi:hypothetical protein
MKSVKLRKISDSNYILPIRNEMIGEGLESSFKRALEIRFKQNNSDEQTCDESLVNEMEWDMS